MIPHESNTLSHPSPPLLHTFLEGFSTVQSSEPCWWIPLLENGSPWWLHSQIFSDNLPNIVVVHAQFTCYQSNSWPMIATHHLPHALSVGLRPVHWRPSSSWGHLPHFEPLVPLENLGAWHSHLHTLTAVVWVLLTVIPSWTRNIRLFCCFVPIT